MRVVHDAGRSCLIALVVRRSRCSGHKLPKQLDVEIASSGLVDGEENEKSARTWTAERACEAVWLRGRVCDVRLGVYPRGEECGWLWTGMKQKKSRAGGPKDSKIRRERAVSAPVLRQAYSVGRCMSRHARTPSDAIGYCTVFYCVMYRERARCGDKNDGSVLYCTVGTSTLRCRISS
nr:hypothetical protein CFP56_59664 [Quercus suber]